MIRSDEETKEIFVLILIFGGIAVFGWQIYEYLRFSIWPAVSIISALVWMDIAWAVYPTDWIGLHNILGKISLALALEVLGVLIAIDFGA